MWGKPQVFLYSISYLFIIKIMHFLKKPTDISQHIGVQKIFVE